MTGASEAGPTSTLIHSARVWSDGQMLPETALLVSDGKIAALGGEELIAAHPEARRIDARGGLLTPSFVDAHVHSSIGGSEQLRCDLTGCDSAEDVFDTIVEYAAAHPDAPWILGGGWSMAFFPGGTPKREELDALVPDRPVFLLNADHHGGWANTRALELAGITSETKDPSDGRIERDSDGVPSGTLHEGATDLLNSVLPRATREEQRAAVQLAEQLLFSYGVTGWQEAMLGDYAGYSDFTPIFRELIDEGLLTARQSGALWVSRDFGGMSIPEFVDDLDRRRARYEREGLQLDTVKIMVDGVVENETAALDAPYVAECSCTGGSGLAYFSAEQLLELVPLVNSRGFSAHFHAIGDRAVRYALDAVAAVPEEVRATVRNHIAHLQLINPVDVPRFSELGVTANLQSLWACNDVQLVELGLPILGEPRAQWHYLFRSLELAGANLACGSDWPVSTPDPWQAMHVAVNRRDPDYPEVEPLLPQEALSLASVLKAYTRGSHELVGFPGGRIAVGEPADLALADRDPFAADASEISLTRNRLTVLRGNVVFEADEAVEVTEA